MPKRAPIGLTEEGTRTPGVVATCKGCGWLVWSATRKETTDAAKAHRCRKGERCGVCGGGTRIGDETCPHYFPTKKAAGDGG